MSLEILIADSSTCITPDRSEPPESFLMPMEFTTADLGHPCGYKKGHWLDAGMARLTVRSDSAEHHYCLECAKALLIQGAEQLRLLIAGSNLLSGV